jgi:hypothetical protein
MSCYPQTMEFAIVYVSYKLATLSRTEVIFLDVRYFDCRDFTFVAEVNSLQIKP